MRMTGNFVAVAGLLLLGCSDQIAGPDNGPGVLDGRKGEAAGEKDSHVNSQDNGLCSGGPSLPCINAPGGMNFSGTTVGPVSLCPAGSYAKAFSVSLEGALRGRGDDSAVNAIRLTCSNPSNWGRSTGRITSATQEFGTYGAVYSCPEGTYLVQYQLKVEGWQGQEGDDTAVNQIKFACGRVNQPNPVVALLPPSQMSPWGVWTGRWGKCPDTYVIAGIRTLVQRWMRHMDDTALNDVAFFCRKDA